MADVYVLGYASIFENPNFDQKNDIMQIVVWAITFA